MNYAVPALQDFDLRCSMKLKGSPCWIYTLPDATVLVTNFGRDNGMADWFLTEVILGYRDALVARGNIIPR